MSELDPLDLEMSKLSAAGLVLAVVGGLLLIFDGVDYTTQETVLDMGPIQATAETRDRLPFPDWLGAVGVVGGGLLISIGAIRESRK